jgi:hypothetical protein
MATPPRFIDLAFKLPGHSFSLKPRATIPI